MVKPWVKRGKGREKERGSWVVLVAGVSRLWGEKVAGIIGRAQRCKEEKWILKPILVGLL